MPKRFYSWSHTKTFISIKVRDRSSDLATSSIYSRAWGWSCITACKTNQKFCFHHPSFAVWALTFSFLCLISCDLADHCVAAWKIGPCCRKLVLWGQWGFVSGCSQLEQTIIFKLEVSEKDSAATWSASPLWSEFEWLSRRKKRREEQGSTGL